MNDQPSAKPVPPAGERSQAEPQPVPLPKKKVPEIGGPPGPEPTRYGDWERNGRCVDF